MKISPSTKQNSPHLLQKRVDSNVIDGYVAQVLEIVPDVHPDHVHALIIQHLPTYFEEVVQPVLHILFEDPTYPKLIEKGNAKG